MSLFANRVRVNTATTGQGTVSLGSAYSSAFLSDTEAGMVDGGTYSYLIEEGNDVEIGRGVYSSSAHTLTRAAVLKSKIGGTAGTTKMTLAGGAIVNIIAASEDLAVLGDITKKASTSEVLAGTAGAGLTADNVVAALGPVALADGANIATDMATGVYFTVTLAGNRTMSAPTNYVVGRTIYYKIKQDATGSRTLTWNSAFDFGQDTAPALSTGANVEDLIAFLCTASGKMTYLGLRKDIG